MTEEEYPTYYPNRVYKSIQPAIIGPARCGRCHQLIKEEEHKCKHCGWGT
jgi:hypothetical protein